MVASTCLGVQHCRVEVNLNRSKSLEREPSTSICEAGTRVLLQKARNIVQPALLQDESHSLDSFYRQLRCVGQVRRVSAAHDLEQMVGNTLVWRSLVFDYVARQGFISTLLISSVELVYTRAKRSQDATIWIIFQYCRW